jgi:hypothetical protein
MNAGMLVRDRRARSKRCSPGGAPVGAQLLVSSRQPSQDPQAETKLPPAHLSVTAAATADKSEMGTKVVLILHLEGRKSCKKGRGSRV